jgi:hypothetical protein
VLPWLSMQPVPVTPPNRPPCSTPLNGLQVFFSSPWGGSVNPFPAITPPPLKPTHRSAALAPLAQTSPKAAMDFGEAYQTSFST